MNKYIDADKLIAEIERREVILNKYKDSFETAACCKQELEWMKDFITSIQYEKPEVDLEKEIERFCEDMWDSLPNFNYSDGKAAITVVEKSARHFYELGLNARKEE